MRQVMLRRMKVEPNWIRKAFAGKQIENRMIGKKTTEAKSQ